MKEGAYNTTEKNRRVLATVQHFTREKCYNLQ